MSSLSDQLLKAGLVTEDQVNKAAEKPKKKPLSLKNPLQKNPIIVTPINKNLLILLNSMVKEKSLKTRKNKKKSVRKKKPLG